MYSSDYFNDKKESFILHLKNVNKPNLEIKIKGSHKNVDTKKISIKKLMNNISKKIKDVQKELN